MIWSSPDALEVTANAQGVQQAPPRIVSAATALKIVNCLSFIGSMVDVLSYFVCCLNALPSVVPALPTTAPRSAREMPIGNPPALGWRMTAPMKSEAWHIIATRCRMVKDDHWVPSTASIWPPQGARVTTGSHSKDAGRTQEHHSDSKKYGSEDQNRLDQSHH